MGVKNKRNLVTSFITAFAGSGSIEGICIKFVMFDGSTRLSYLESRWFMALHECAEYYSAIHYYGSDLQRSAEEPGFLASLPKRHPARTMSDEKPQLTPEEYQTAKDRHLINSLRMIDEGAVCRIECSYLGGERRIEVLPAFIVMNLCVSLKASFDMADSDLLTYACDFSSIRH